MLTDLIIKSGKTRKELIEAVGFSQGYLSLLESGERKVGARYLHQLAGELGVEPAVLRPDLAQFFTPSSESCQPDGSLPPKDVGSAKRHVKGAA